jgi:DNA processing protein
VGLVGLRTLVRRFGSARAAMAALPSRVRATCRGFVPPGDDERREVDRALSTADRLGMRIVTWSDPGYPSSLTNLHDPPPLLFLRGRTRLLAARSVTVVGARRATSRARDVAERLGRELGRSGVCVASGMALGVDGAAHRGALGGDGETVAVLGSGPDRAYPGSHGRLFQDILERGLVVSEFAPGTPPLPHHFPRRNRVLAALARAVVVVEAGARSGALITVDHALDLGVDVWAVPGPIDHAGCVGSNRLLADGARPLLSVSSFVADITSSALPVSDPLPGAVSEPVSDRADPARRVLSELAREPMGVDELASRLGLPAPALLTLLTELELGGSVRRLPGMRFSLAA